MLFSGSSQPGTAAPLPAQVLCPVAPAPREHCTLVSLWWNWPLARPHGRKPVTAFPCSGQERSGGTLLTPNQHAAPKPVPHSEPSTCHPIPTQLCTGPLCPLWNRNVSSSENGRPCRAHHNPKSLRVQDPWGETYAAAPSSGSAGGPCKWDDGDGTRGQQPRVFTWLRDLPSCSQLTGHIPWCSAPLRCGN